MIDRIRLLLLTFPLTRTILRLLPAGPRVLVRGRSSCRIPASLVPYIVDTIDARAIHHASDVVRLDGGLLDDLSERLAPGLTLRQMAHLRAAGDIGTESAALTFNGDVVIEVSDAAMIERARERGASVGFQYVNDVMAMAGRAAFASGRPLSGAL